MEAKDLRAIIEQVLQEMNVSPSNLKAAESAPAAQPPGHQEEEKSSCRKTA